MRTATMRGGHEREGGERERERRRGGREEGGRKGDSFFCTCGTCLFFFFLCAMDGGGGRAAMAGARVEGEEGGQVGRACSLATVFYFSLVRSTFIFLSTHRAHHGLRLGRPRPCAAGGVHAYPPGRPGPGAPRGGGGSGA